MEYTIVTSWTGSFEAVNIVPLLIRPTPSRPLRVMTSPQQAEQALVRALAAGEPRAYNELVGRHHHSLVRLARNFVRSEAIAEEVAQDTWCGVITGIGGFGGRSSLKTWIFAICVNRARTRGARERRTIPFSSLGAPVDDHGGEVRAWENPQRRAVSLELRTDLRVALARLPERQRLVVTLRDVEGLEIEEIGRLLAVTAGNTRVLLHRGRARLSAILADPAAGLTG